MHLTANFQRENAWLRKDYAYISIFFPTPPTSSLETYLYEVGSRNDRGLSIGVNSRLFVFWGASSVAEGLEKHMLPRCVQRCLYISEMTAVAF